MTTGAVVKMGGSCSVGEVGWRKVSNVWFMWRPICREKKKEEEEHIWGREGNAERSFGEGVDDNGDGGCGSYFFLKGER